MSQLKEMENLLKELSLIFIRAHKWPTNLGYYFPRIISHDFSCAF